MASISSSSQSHSNLERFEYLELTTPNRPAVMVPFPLTQTQAQKFEQTCALRGSDCSIQWRVNPPSLWLENKEGDVLQLLSVSHPPELVRLQKAALSRLKEMIVPLIDVGANNVLLNCHSCWKQLSTPRVKQKVLAMNKTRRIALLLDSLPITPVPQGALTASSARSLANHKIGFCFFQRDNRDGNDITVYMKYTRTTELGMRKTVIQIDDDRLHFKTAGELSRLTPVYEARFTVGDVDDFQSTFDCAMVWLGHSYTAIENAASLVPIPLPPPARSAASSASVHRAHQAVNRQAPIIPQPARSWRQLCWESLERADRCAEFFIKKVAPVIALIAAVWLVRESNLNIK